MTVNAGSTDIDSYFVTHTEFETLNNFAKSTDDDGNDVIPTIGDTVSSPSADDKYTGITTFYISGSSPKWTGTKAQPWPDAGWNEMYRFEKGDRAVGSILYYN